MKNVSDKLDIMSEVNDFFFSDFAELNSSPLNHAGDENVVVSTLDTCSRMSGRSVFVIDFVKHEMIYRSKYLLFVDEAATEDFQRDCIVPYWSLASEQAMEKGLTIRSHFFRGDFGSIIAGDYAWTCMSVFPIILRGHEFFITQKYTPLIIHPDSAPRYGLFEISHSNSKEMRSEIVMSDGRFFIFSFEEQRFIERPPACLLSKTERAILERSRMGYSIEEMAHCLYVTTSTIKTHRRRIFKKLNVKSITEAILIYSSRF